VETQIMDINNELMERYGNVTMTGVIMFVNKITFFLCISRAIKFATLEMIAIEKMQLS
jgi:hypothetical protein